MKRTLIAILALAMVTVVGCGAKEEPKNETVEMADVQVTPAPEVDENTDEQIITDEQALNAIKNYCFANNPDLKEMIGEDEYTLYWEIESSDDSEIVVLYRSYTGALVRYYIDAKTV